MLQAEGAGVDLPEALLQLACRDVDHYTIPSDEKEYVLLNERARGECCLLSLFIHSLLLLFLFATFISLSLAIVP